MLFYPWFSSSCHRAWHFMNAARYWICEPDLCLLKPIRTKDISNTLGVQQGLWSVRHYESFSLIITVVMLTSWEGNNNLLGIDCPRHFSFTYIVSFTDEGSERLNDLPKVIHLARAEPGFRTQGVRPWSLFSYPLYSTVPSNNCEGTMEVPILGANSRIYKTSQVHPSVTLRALLYLTTFI